MKRKGKKQGAKKNLLRGDFLVNVAMVTDDDFVEVPPSGFAPSVLSQIPALSPLDICKQ